MNDIALVYLRDLEKVHHTLKSNDEGNHDIIQFLHGQQKVAYSFGKHLLLCRRRCR